MQMNHICSNSVAEIEAELKELQTASTNTDTFLAWVDNSKLQFYDKKDKAKKYPKNIEQFLSEYKDQLGHRATAQEAQAFLKYLIDFKNDFKTDAIKAAKLKITKGAKYTKEYLASTTKEVELRDELLHKNAKDVNLFQNFKLCGDQLVLIDGTECELLKEDLQGNVVIDNSMWLTGKIAARVEFTFQSKIRTYYNKFAEFLATLDTTDIDIDLDHDVVETPIEDFIQTELPTVMLYYYTVKAVYSNWNDEQGRTHKQLDHYELKRNQKIQSFNDIFRWTLRNWSSFKHCIQGQDKFLAWSNNSDEIAVSHWFPEEVHTIPQPWKEFMDEKMPSRHLQMRLVTFLGMCIDAKNSTQQYLIISDQGGTGKGVMMRALEHAFPKNSIAPIESSALADGNEFGLSGIKIWNNHISVMEEYSDGNMMTDKAKKIIANNSVSLNVKGKSHILWEPINHKFIIFSNKKATIKAFSNRRRAIPLTFVGKYQWTEEKQQALNDTAKDFLNFCYTSYKKCPLLVNNSYLVLCEESEQEFLKNGKVNLKDEDTESKKAFNEECLKSYFNTDEYTESDDYVDFENFFNTNFEECDDSCKVSEVVDKCMEALEADDKHDYWEAFGATEVHGHLYLSTRNKQWWKWCEFLKNKGFTNKPKKEGKLVYKVWTGFRPIDSKGATEYFEPNVTHGANDNVDYE